MGTRRDARRPHGGGASSLPYLAEQAPVSSVARLVGYRTTSAYVAGFRAHTGVTPGRYFQPPG